MTKRTAQLLSTIGHPFLLLPVVFTWLTLQGAPIQEAWPTLAAVLGSIGVMGLFLVFRKRKGKISNWDVSTQSERSRNIYQPMLILVGMAAAALYLLRQPFAEETLFFGLLMVVCYAINAWIKISQHTVVAFYLSFLLMPVQLWLGIGLLVFAAFIGWSRVVLGRHQRIEVALGMLVGIIFGLLQIWIFR